MVELPLNGMIHWSSVHSVAETLARLEVLLRSKGLADLCADRSQRRGRESGP